MTLAPDWQVLEALIARIHARRDADPAQSYVAKLLHRPVKKLAQKVAEEGAEVAIAAVSEGREALIGECADLLFHLLVLCERQGIAVQDVLHELQRREAVSGLKEKAARDDTI